MKLDNRVLKEAHELENMIKTASARLSEIKQAVRKKGAFATKDFAVNIKPQTVERMVGKEAFIKAFGRETLEEKSLIQTIQYDVVKIVKIAA